MESPSEDKAPLEKLKKNKSDIASYVDNKITIVANHWIVNIFHNFWQTLSLVLFWIYGPYCERVHTMLLTTQEFDLSLFYLKEFCSNFALFKYGWFVWNDCLSIIEMNLMQIFYGYFISYCSNATLMRKCMSNHHLP